MGGLSRADHEAEDAYENGETRVSDRETGGRTERAEPTSAAAGDSGAKRGRDHLEEPVSAEPALEGGDRIRRARRFDLWRYNILRPGGSGQVVARFL